MQSYYLKSLLNNFPIVLSGDFNEFTMVTSYMRILINVHVYIYTFRIDEVVINKEH